MTGFEPATTRPPDVYSNRAELHPARRLAKLRQKIQLHNLPKPDLLYTQVYRLFS